MRLTSILTLSSAFLASNAQSADFKGIQLDNIYSNETIQAKAGYDLGYNLGNSIRCNVYCSGQIQIGQGLGKANFFTNKDGSIGDIEVITDVRDFASIESQLVGKFGAPSHVAKQQLQNAFGAKVLNTIDEWRRPNGDVITLFHFIDMESGSLSMTSAKHRAEDSAFRAARSKEGSI